MKCDDMVGAANRRAGPGFEPPVIGLGDSVTHVGASSGPRTLLKPEPLLTESHLILPRTRQFEREVRFIPNFVRFRPRSGRSREHG